MSDGEKKAKKEAKVVEASPRVVEATKRHAEGKATAEDFQILANTPEAERRAARKAAGVKSRRGGFRSNVDMWVKRAGQESAVKSPKADWKAFGDLKRETAESGKKISIALVPSGTSPK